ncbi:MAG: MFS transporter [Nitrolancea sp.]
MSEIAEVTPGFLSRYRQLLAAPGVARIVAAGTVTRLPTSMLSLAVPLLVVGQTGSYVSAGLVTACFAIAAGVSGPVRGRAVDRLGASLILVITGCGQALGLFGIVLLAGSTNSVLWIAVAAALSGALVPPVSPIMRVLWTRQVQTDLRDVAFAFESITIDILYITGPMLVAFLIAVAPVETALLVAAACSALGATVLALAPGTRGWQPSPRAAHWLGPLRSGNVRRLLPIGLLIPGSLTAVELGIIAFSSAHGAKALSGVLIAAMSVGSIAGGIYWGGRTQPGTPRRQLALLLFSMAAGMALLTLSRNVLLLGVLLLFVGLALAPSITVEYSLMAEVAPPDEITESFSWVNALGQAGAAAAVAVAGLFVTRMHDTGGFALAAVLAATAGLLASLFAPDAQPHAGK